MTSVIGERRRAKFGAVGAALSLGLVAAQPAQASCVRQDARDQLARADAAFVGRLMERRGDVLEFAVDESLKGDLGERVEVRDEAPLTSVSLRPEVGRRIGLVMRRDQAGYHATDCDRADPDELRAAAQPSRTCGKPRVASLTVVRRTRRRVWLRAVLSDSDGRLSGIDIDWGDGRKEKALLSRGDSTRRTVRLEHRYRRAGRRRIRFVAESAPAEGCSTRVERSAPRVLTFSNR